MTQAVEATSSRVSVTTPAAHRGVRWFFVGVSVAMLVALLIAFARTFFLRTFFERPPISGYQYMHGTVLTAWFVLVFAQTGLVATHRTDLHRRLGVLGVIVAILVVGISPVVVFQFVPAAFARGDNPLNIRFIAIDALMSLIVFSVLVATAIRVRHRPDAHKRLMLLSCFCIFGPVSGRLGSLFDPPLGIRFSLVIVLLVVVLVAYDLRSLKRVHSANQQRRTAHPRRDESR